MDTDSIFNEVGSCGLFQVCHVILIQLHRMTSCFSMFLMTFNIYDPGWKCKKYAITLNESHRYKEPNERDNGTFSYLAKKLISGQRNDIRNITQNVNLANKDIMMHTNTSNEDYNWTCDMVKFCDSVEFNPQSVTLVSEFGLICDETFVLSIIVSINLVGTLCGSLLAGQTGEIFGRKTSIYTNTLLFALFQFIAIFSVSWKMYAAMTFLSGFAIGCLVTINLVYTSEYLNSKWRGNFAGIPVWNISMAILAILITIFKDWRYLHVATATFALLSFLGAFWVPESFRWLYVHSKSKEMANVLNKMAKTNKQVVNVNEIMANIPEHTYEEDRMRKYTYFDLIKTSYLRSLTIKCSSGWFLLCISYHAFNYGIKDLSGDFYTNLLLAGFTEIPCMLLIIPLVNSLGRKKTFLIFESISGLCCVVIVTIFFCVDNEIGNDIVKYLAIVAKGTVYAGFSSLSVLSLELFPTVVRNLGSGVLQVSAMAGGILASYLIAEKMIHVFYLVTAISIIFTIGLIMTLPETNKLSLEEWLEETDKNDNEDCNEQLNRCGI